MASNSKSLEEMLSSEVDESAISALVGSLETQLERPMTQDMTQIGLNTLNNVNHLSKGSNIMDNNTNSTQIQTNNSVNSVNNSLMTAINANANLTQIIANNITTDNNKRIIINNTNSSNSINNSIQLINSNSTNININSNTNTNINSTNINNKLLPQSLSTTTSGSLPGALPASGYINQVSNPSTVSLNSVNSGIPANQILQNAIKVSAMPNGSPNPSPLQQSLQTAQQLSTIQSTTRPSNTIALSAITPSLVITQNKTTTGGKPSQTLLIATTKDGPMLVQPSNNPLQQQNTNSNTNNNESSNTTTGVSLPTTSSVVTIASRNMVSTANSSGQQNLMQHLVSNTNPIQFQLVTNVNTSRPTNQTNIGTQKTLAPRVVQLPPNMRLTQQVIRPGAGQGFAGQSTITLPSNLVRAGTIFVKTENGQVHMVNVAPQPMPQSSANATPGNIQSTTYRLQVPTTATSQTTVRHLGNQQIVLPVSMANALNNKNAPQSGQVQVSQPLTIQTSAANAQAATTPSQMSPNTAKKKCKNFLSTLIRLASDQPDQVANNVKNLIQGLIDDAIQPEDFTNQLQKELNSSPQPCLVPFLKKSLPYLRYSLMQKELTIEGVRPPPHGAVSLPPQSQAIPQIQIASTPPRPGIPQTVRLLHPVSGLMPGQTATVLTPLTQASRLPTPQNLIRSTTVQMTPPSRPTSKSSSKSRAPAAKDKEKKNSFASALRDDDDINDVAAMGGVNLQEESQRILASNAEIVGQQIRSCKDENFLYTTPLHTRINEIARKYGLEECPPDVVSLVSHAVQERLKTLVEKLGVIAEHRQEQLKNDPKYEVLQDVKSQVHFLQELDRNEKKKHEEQEKEELKKAAKSRSKGDDPEQQAIKLRAKEMQRQEMEELRQREANETALQAIGNPKKRLKTSFNSISTVSNSFASSSSTPSLNSFSSTPLKPIRRIKRVSIRDLHFLMEHEKETVRTPMLYRAYAK